MTPKHLSCETKHNVEVYLGVHFVGQLEIVCVSSRPCPPITGTVYDYTWRLKNGNGSTYEGMVRHRHGDPWMILVARVLAPHWATDELPPEQEAPS